MFSIRMSGAKERYFRCFVDNGQRFSVQFYCISFPTYTYFFKMKALHYKLRWEIKLDCKIFRTEENKVFNKVTILLQNMMSYGFFIYTFTVKSSLQLTIIIIIKNKKNKINKKIFNFIKIRLKVGEAQQLFI